MKNEGVANRHRLGADLHFSKILVSPGPLHWLTDAWIDHLIGNSLAEDEVARQEFIQMFHAR
jgi:hypothetical protein